MMLGFSQLKIVNDCPFCLGNSILYMKRSDSMFTLSIIHIHVHTVHVHYASVLPTTKLFYSHIPHACTYTVH